jgi:acetyl esterase/lipase
MMLPRLLARPGTLLLLVTAAMGSPARASEAGKLLPAETDAILTVNVRQFLDDHRKTEFVQRVLEPWRLALAGDEGQLKKYYRDRDLLKTEGVVEQDFLRRAATFKSACDALGLNPFQDVDRITCGFRKRDGSWMVLVEGRFNQDRFPKAVKQLAQEHFGSFKLTKAGASEIWQVPDADGVSLVLLNAGALVLTDGPKAMEEVLARASGKKDGGLSAGMRTLLDRGAKEHLALLVSHLDGLLGETAKFLEGEVAKALPKGDVVGKLIVDQVVAWIRKYEKDILSGSIGLSIGEDDIRLQFGLETRKRELAEELQKQAERGNLVAVLALKLVKNDLAGQLADILVRVRVSVKDTALVTHALVPHDFIKEVLNSPLLDRSLPSHPFVEALSRQVTSIPIWGPSGPPPQGALEVEEVLDVAYREDPKASTFRHRLDMYLPKGKKDYPVVVLVHGGAWMVGDNRCCGLYPTIARFLAGQGIGVVLPNYRLSPGVRHPEHVQDLARAVAWTRKNIAEHGGGPERIYLLGHSAGGHLVALLATDESYLKAEGLTGAAIKGVIAADGVYRIPHGSMDFTVGGWGTRAFRLDQMYPLRTDMSPLPNLPIPGIPGNLNVFGPVFGDDPKERDNASPVTHVRRGLPPFLILSADHDLPTLPEMADEFQKALLRAGCDSRLLKLEKRNHNSLMFSAITPEDPAARAILEFVRGHEKKR